MSLLKKALGKKIHTRKIDVATYDYDDTSIIVEGILKDDRLQSYYTLLRKKCSPQTLHHMVIRMQIDASSLVIKKIKGEMPDVPEDECPETLKSLEKVKGLTISSGFTAKVKKALGGTRGCSHLTTLLLAMAPAALQGYFAKHAQEPLPETLSADVIKQTLGNTCFVWREEGPLMKEIEDELG